MRGPDYKVDAQGCWIWLKSTSRGYGYKWDGERLVPAHRFYYLQAAGPIPEGCDLHHKCENPVCVNPDHLEPLSRREHIAKHRPTHCCRGHELTDDNLRRVKGKRGRCKTCHRLSERARARGLTIAQYVATGVTE